MLHEKTIVDSDLEADPRKKTTDMFTRNVMNVSTKCVSTYQRCFPSGLGKCHLKATHEVIFSPIKQIFIKPSSNHKKRLVHQLRQPVSDSQTFASLEAITGSVSYSQSLASLETIGELVSNYQAIKLSSNQRQHLTLIGYTNNEKMTVTQEIFLIPYFSWVTLLVSAILMINEFLNCVSR